MSRFAIRDGAEVVPVSPQEWNDWHMKLNKSPQDKRRTVDSHTLRKHGSVVKVKTLFTGGPDYYYITFITGHPGYAIHCDVLIDAMTEHHAAVHELLARNWILSEAYNPQLFLKD